MMSCGASTMTLIASARGFTRKIVELDSQLAISMLDKFCFWTLMFVPLLLERLKDCLVNALFGIWSTFLERLIQWQTHLQRMDSALLMNMRIYDVLPSFFIIPYRFDACNTLYLRVSLGNQKHALSTKTMLIWLPCWNSIFDSTNINDPALLMCRSFHRCLNSDWNYMEDEFLGQLF